jgi:phosphoesterase RecJ-like protein
MKNTFSEEFLDAIKTPQNTILITPHDNPDGDALGAAVGFATLLKILHTEASITILITPKAQEDVLSFFDPEKKIAIISQTDAIPDICETADTWYIVDVAVKEKIGLFQESFKRSGAKKICIDHHHNIPSSEFDIVHIDPTASASSLLIWELWKALGQDEKIDPKTAEALYGGIISDTGGWMHTNTESRGMHAGAELLDK